MRGRSELEQRREVRGAAVRLQLYGHPFVVVADPCLRLFHAKKDERFIVRPVVVLSQTFKMFVPRRAHFFAHEVFKPCFAAMSSSS